MSSPSRMHRFIMAGLLLAGLAAWSRAEPRAGERLPPWDGIKLEGTMPEIAGRVLLVDFWASWCAPCKASFPDLAEIHRDYAQRGVTIVGISVDKDARAYAAFLRRHAPPFATLRDAQQEYATAVGVPAMPTSLVVGRDGRIREVFPGYHGEKTGTALRAALDAALAENL